MAPSKRSLFTCLTIFVAMALPPGAAYGANQEDAQHLYRVVVSDLGGVELSPDVSDPLRSLIRSGLDEYKDAKMTEREVGAGKFAGEMVKNARFDESSGKKIVDLDSFHKAASICPLYPFC